MPRKPRRVPKELHREPITEVQVIGLSVEQLDKQRVRCIITLSEISRPPDLVIALEDIEGSQLAGITILETPDVVNKFVLHLKNAATEVKLVAFLKYDEVGIISQMEKVFALD